MQNERNQAAVHESAAAPPQQSAIAQSYIQNFAAIKSAIYEEWPEALFYTEEAVMDSLAANLWRYTRPPGDGFVRWAQAWVRRQTRRYRFLTELNQNHRGLIYAAVQRAMFGSPAEDFAVEPCDNEADLYIHLLENPRKIDVLLKPDRAKPTTRLYGLTKSRQRAYRKKINKRRELVELQNGVGKCESVTSDEEIAAVSASAAQRKLKNSENS